MSFWSIPPVAAHGELQFKISKIRKFVRLIEKEVSITFCTNLNILNNLVTRRRHLVIRFTTIYILSFYFFKMKSSFFINNKFKIQESYTVRIIEKSRMEGRERIRRCTRTSELSWHPLAPPKYSIWLRDGQIRLGARWGVSPLLTWVFTLG